MSYSRDPDRATRGVGAIASVDNALPAARWRKQQVGRALLRRDRVMSAIAQGALGKVDPGATAPPPGDHRGTSPSVTFTNPDGSRTIVNDHRAHPQLPTVAPAPSRPPVDPTRIPFRGPTGKIRGAPIAVTSTQLPATALPPAALPPSAQPPALPLPPQIQQPTPGSGTVGTGGSLPTTPVLTAPPADMLGPLPTMSDPNLSSASTDDGTTKMLLIAGGAALVAFLLFRGQS